MGKPLARKNLLGGALVGAEQCRHGEPLAFEILDFLEFRARDQKMLRLAYRHRDEFHRKAAKNTAQGGTKGGRKVDIPIEHSGGAEPGIDLNELERPFPLR